MRSHEPAQDELCAGEDGRAAGGADAGWSARPVGRPPHPVEQCDPWLCGRVWAGGSQGDRQDRAAADTHCRRRELPAARQGLVRHAGQRVCPAQAGTSQDRSQMAWHRGNELSRRLAEIPSVGPIGATLSVMKVGNPHAFRSGRDFSAWLGMTPKDHSTAGKVRLGAITKAGDEALRSVLVAGATSVIQQVRKGRGRPSPWLVALVKRKPPKLAAVALANKTARIIWKLMVSGERYNPQRAPQRFVPPTDSLAPGTRRQGQAACGGDLRSALTAPALCAPSAPPSA